MQSCNSRFKKLHHAMSLEMMERNVKILNEVNFTRILETFYSFGYHLAVFPYHFYKGENGRYKVHRWWPQTVLTYSLCFINLFYITRELSMKLLENVDNLKSDPSNPIHFLRVLENAFYFFSYVIRIYKQNFNEKKTLALINSIQSYSVKYSSSRQRENHQAIIKILSIPLMIMITVFGITVPFCAFFVLKTPSAYFQSLTSDIQALFNPFTSKTKLLFLSFIYGSIRHVRDAFMEIFILVGILTFWLISVDFKASLSQEKKKFQEQNQQQSSLRLVGKLTSVKRYKSICGLSRTYNKAMGTGIVCNILVTVLFFSLRLAHFTSPDLTPMQKSLTLPLWIINLLTIVLPAIFASNMSSLKQLTNLRKITNCPFPRQNLLITHMVSTNVSAIKAKVFSLTFSSLTMICLNVAIIFLVCGGAQR